MSRVAPHSVCWIKREMFPSPSPFVSSGRRRMPTLDARLTAVGRRGAPAWLIIRAPDGEPDMAAWQAALHGLLDRHGSSLAILEVSVDRQPARVASFALQVAATEARANRDAIRIAIGGPAMADRDRREAAVSSGTRPVCRSAGPPGRRH